MRVRKNSVYEFKPCGWDVVHPCHRGNLKEGDHVRVIHSPGCPPPNTMESAHVETLDGDFIGLVSTHSLSQ